MGAAGGLRELGQLEHLPPRERPRQGDQDDDDVDDEEEPVERLRAGMM